MSQPVNRTDFYFRWTRNPFVRPAEMTDGREIRHPVAIVGAGPVGLAMALQLANYDIPVVLLEAGDTVSDGSRAVAMNRRTMQILDRIGVGERVSGMAWTWDRNSTFYGSDLVYEMALPHPAHEKHAPMTNLQQCWMEQIMVDRAAETGLVDVRWQSAVAAVEPQNDHVALGVETPEGRYTLRADYVVACDGPRSPVRRAMGLELSGTRFEKRYIIADFHMKSDMPMGRRAWFDPPYSRGSTILMHKTPFDIWRLDYQLRDDEDSDEAARPDVVTKRISDHLAMMGETAEWELIWVSMYRANALTLARYDHGRVLFAGDAAHQVPIFGGRGLNHGYADTANLGWKLAAAIQGRAPAGILESYSDERQKAIVDTIEDLTKITLYMTTPNHGVELMRDAVLSLSLTEDFVKQLFDPFRFAPYRHADSPLNSAPDEDARFAAGPPVGLMVPDLPLEKEGRATGLYADADGRFTGLYFAGIDGPAEADRSALERLEREKDIRPMIVGGPNGAYRDPDVLAGRLYDAEPGTFYLIRPDDYVAARWKSFDPDAAAVAVDTASGR